MNAQQIPTSDEPLGRGIDITGQRIGLLTAIRPIAKVYGEKVWLFECWCGRYAIRRVGQVRSSKKNGHAPQCYTCAGELGRGKMVAAANEANQRSVARYQETGALWSAWELARLEHQIRKDVEKDLGIKLTVDDSPKELPILLWDNEGPGISADYHRIASSMRDDLDPEAQEKRIREGRVMRALDRYLADHEIRGLKEYGKILELESAMARVYGGAA